ncbi:MAG: ribonuclease III [Armatimonadota bacterium]
MSDPHAEYPWNRPEWRESLRSFGAPLGFGPEHEELLAQAFTHRGLSEEAPHGDNERLELLGDAVLALVVSEHLYHAYPDEREGRLTKMKITYVAEPSLARAAEALELGALLAVAPADDAAGVRERPSTLSDLFEAVLGALYLAQGLEAARHFVLRELVRRVDPDEVRDYKSRLQELWQERQRVTPVYRTSAESGPAHNRVFLSEAMVGDRVLGVGRGGSKKVAEQEAAREALLRERGED